MNTTGQTISDILVAAIVDEGRWLSHSMGLAFVVVAILVIYARRRHVPTRRLVLAAMNLLVGVTIGTMAFGHLLAVTTKLILGTLTGPTLVLYLIGIALAAPSWSMIVHSPRLVSGETHDRRALVLNTWLVATLLALGLPNIPLAVPALLNIAYGLTARRVVGWTIAGVALALNLALFVASLAFWASGQTFEQFQGIESRHRDCDGHRPAATASSDRCRASLV